MDKYVVVNHPWEYIMLKEQLLIPPKTCCHFMGESCKCQFFFSHRHACMDAWLFIGCLSQLFIPQVSDVELENNPISTMATTTSSGWEVANGFHPLPVDPSHTVTLFPPCGFSDATSSSSPLSPSFFHFSSFFSFLLHSHHHSLPPPPTLMTISPAKILSAQLISDVSGWIHRSLLSSSEVHNSLSTFESECREVDEDEMMLRMCFCHWGKGTGGGLYKLRSRGPAASTLIPFCVWAIECLANRSPYGHLSCVAIYMCVCFHGHRAQPQCWAQLKNGLCSCWWLTSFQIDRARAVEAEN